MNSKTNNKIQPKENKNQEVINLFKSGEIKAAKEKA